LLRKKASGEEVREVSSEAQLCRETARRVL